MRQQAKSRYLACPFWFLILCVSVPSHVGCSAVLLLSITDGSSPYGTLRALGSGHNLGRSPSDKQPRSSGSTIRWHKIRSAGAFSVPITTQSPRARGPVAQSRVTICMADMEEAVLCPPPPVRLGETDLHHNFLSCRAPHSSACYASPGSFLTARPRNARRLRPRWKRLGPRARSRPLARLGT